MDAALDLCTLIDLGVYDRRKVPGAASVTRQARVFDDRRECDLVRGDNPIPLITVRDEQERGIEPDSLPPENEVKAKAVVASVLERYFGPGR